MKIPIDHIDNLTINHVKKSPIYKIGRKVKFGLQIVDKEGIKRVEIIKGVVSKIEDLNLPSPGSYIRFYEITFEYGNETHKAMIPAERFAPMSSYSIDSETVHEE